MFFIILCLAALLSVVIYTVRYGISPMPSSRKAKKILLSAISPHFSGTILELGSGWGSLAFPLAQFFPKSTIIAYEISPVPWLFSKLRKCVFPQNNLIILRQNFLSIPFPHPSLIVCYLYPKAMTQLKAKFESELPPGVIILSNTFAISGWIPEAIYEINDIYQTKVYKYVTK